MSNSWEFWDAAKVTQIKRAKRVEVATDNENRQKETKRLREHLIEEMEVAEIWGRGNKCRWG